MEGRRWRGGDRREEMEGRRWRGRRWRGGRGGDGGEEMEGREGRRWRGGRGGDGGEKWVESGEDAKICMFMLPGRRKHGSIC